MLWKTKASGTSYMCSAILLILLAVISALVLGETINSKGCGRSKPLGRIFNGQRATKKEIPWIVSLIALLPAKDGNNNMVYGCGGSIISPSFILTAAHCLYDPDTHKRVLKILVYYNSTKKFNGAQRIVQKAIHHENFDPKDNRTLGYDISIMKLNRRLEFDDYVTPVCLPGRKFDIAGRIFLIAGWGKTEKKPTSPVLLRAKVKGMPSKKCKEFLDRANIGGEDSTMICVKADDGTLCSGDSGGPMTIRKKNGKSVLLGIIESGTSCDPKKSFSLGIRVSGYMSWIKKQMKRLESSLEKTTTAKEPVEKTTAEEPVDTTTGKEPVEKTTTELPVEETTQETLDNLTTTDLVEIITDGV